MKPLKLIYTITSYLPAVWLVLFAAFTLRVMIKLGHLPVPSLNDPKDFGFWIHHNLIWFLFLAMLYILAPFWLIVTIIARVKKIKDLNLVSNTFIYIGGSIAVFCLLYFDPWQLATWFAD